MNPWPWQTTWAYAWLFASDHWASISSFAVAITTFVVAPLLINWIMAPAPRWLIAVALLAGRVAGAVLCRPGTVARTRSGALLVSVPRW